jgi:hypothetical protein
LMPLPPDIYSETLSFITMIATSAPDENVKADAKKLVSKMLLFRPAPDPTKILAEATTEEKRKRDRRLAKKNRQPLGSTVHNPPISQASEHVQKLELEPHAGAGIIQAICNSSSERGPESAVTVPASEGPWAGTPLERLVVTPLAAAVGPVDSRSTGRDIARPAEVNALLVQNLVDDYSAEILADSPAQILCPPTNILRAQLVPGKKYQTRPAPSGGYGVYEPHSSKILQWFAGEDDARDAIDLVTSIAVGA